MSFYFITSKKIFNVKIDSLDEYFLDNENISIYVRGYPVFKGSSNIQILIEVIQKENSLEKLSKELDGSFLIIFYNKLEGSFSVINDRFAYYPCYYYHGHNEILISSVFSFFLKNISSLSINKRAIIEFLHFQRLLGEHTYLESVSFLKHSSLLKVTLESFQSTVTSYWSPCFYHSRQSPDEIAFELAESVKYFANACTDKDSVSLLLSGGLDSRLSLASLLNKEVMCITLAQKKNYEVEVAQLVAKAAGKKHVFVPRDPLHYGRYFSSGISGGEGINNVAHNHFDGMEEFIKPYSDTIFHGHGFDIMFQGLYLPRVRVKFLNNLTYIMRLEKISSNLPHHFLNKLKHRYKPITCFDIMNNKQKKNYYESLSSHIQSLLNEGRQYTDDNYNLWDYLLIRNLGRHYTHLNISSLQKHFHERTLAFNNRTFDLYLNTPPKLRLSGGIVAKAIRHLKPDLVNVVCSNTNQLPIYSEARLSYEIFLELCKNKFKLKARIPPAANERSWMSIEDIIYNNPVIYEKIKNLPQSQYLYELDIIDHHQLTSIVSSLEDRSMIKNYGCLLLGFITLNDYLGEHLS